MEKIIRGSFEEIINLEKQVLNGNLPTKIQEAVEMIVVGFRAGSKLLNDG